MFCGQCGKSISETIRFCDSCGAETGSVRAAAAPISTPPPIAKQLSDEVRARSRDAWQGLKLFSRNPVGGLSESFAMLGQDHALQVGVVFAIVFEIAVFLGAYRFASVAAGMMSPFGGLLMESQMSVSSLTAAQTVKLIILGFVPFVSLSGAVSLARLVFGGKGAVAGDIYTSGAAILPMGFLVLIASVLGIANVEVIAVLFMFALTYTILMLYSGCSQIAGIPERGAAPAVPVALVLCAWITKVIVVAIW